MNVQTITPEAFLAQRDYDELEADDAPEVSQGGALDSIAASLQQLVGMAQASTDEEQASDRFREALDDLEAKHGVVNNLVLEIEAIVKPSTSKLANQVREALGRWRGVPEPEPVTVEEAEDSASEHSGAVQCPTCERYFGDDDLLGRHACVVVPVSNAIEMGVMPPSHDAPVGDWRAYARSLGHDITDGANRSQIRTALGLAHA